MEIHYRRSTQVGVGVVLRGQDIRGALRLLVGDVLLPDCDAPDPSVRGLFRRGYGTPDLGW